MNCNCNLRKNEKTIVSTKINVESKTILSDTLSDDELDNICHFEPIQNEMKERVLSSCQKDLLGDYMSLRRL